MKSNLRLRVLLPTAVLALLGIGVGAFAFSGSPGDGPLPPLPTHKAAPPAPVKRSAWAKKANAICVELNEKNAEIRTPQSPGDLVVLLPQSLDNADAALVELRALPVPKADAKRIARMLKHFAQFVALERQAVQAMQAGDAAGYADFTGVAFTQNDRGIVIARKLGAGACGKNGTDDSELARELERHRTVVVALYTPGGQVDTLAVLEARAGAALARAGFVAIDVYDPREISLVAAEYSTRGAPAVLVYVRKHGAVVRFDGYVDRETVAQAVDNAGL